jgi:hypothetical protein
MQVAAGYPSRERFLTELTLDPPDATSDEAGAAYLDEDYLILSTIHSASRQYSCSTPSMVASPPILPPAKSRRWKRNAACRDDAGKAPAGPDHAAALLRAPATPQRRPTPLCLAHALPAGPLSLPKHSLRPARHHCARNPDSEAHCLPGCFLSCTLCYRLQYALVDGICAEQSIERARSETSGGGACVSWRHIHF